MSHGHPDYGPGAAISTVFTTMDLAELAARLGSPVTFDRRGNIIWLDSFEDGLAKWKPAYTGIAGSVELTAVRARSGALSAKITTPADSTSRQRIEHYLPIPILGKLGFEFSFTWDSDIGEIVLYTYLLGPTYRHIAQIRYIGGGYRRWYYYNQKKKWQDLSGIFILHSEDYLFNTAKLVVDYEKREYVRLIVNDTEFSLKGVPYYTDSLTAARFLRFYIEFRPHTNVAVPTYVDDVILTQNEP